MRHTYESWYLSDCRSNPAIRASNIMVQHPDWTCSMFVPPDGGVIQSGCFNGGGCFFHVHVDNYDWHAHTPNATG